MQKQEQANAGAEVRREVKKMRRTERCARYKASRMIAVYKQVMKAASAVSIFGGK